MSAANPAYNVFIISLHESSRRHRNIAQQFESIPNVNYEIKLFHRAETIDVAEYDRDKRLARYGYDMQPGEIGCFLSHRALWKIIGETDRPALILEDDFQITSPQIVTILDAIARCSEQYQIIRLQICADHYQTIPIRDIAGGSLVGYATHKQGGATAYFIHPDAARTLHHKSARFFMPVDDFIDTEWLHRIWVYGIEPPPISIIGDASEIGGRQKPALRLSQKIKREISRAPGAVLSRGFLLYKKYKLLTAKNKDR